MQCTETGQCLCQVGYTGTKCNLCSEGYLLTLGLGDGGKCIRIEKCPDDKWKEIDGKCYLVSEGQTDWEAARQNCLGIGGKLAEPLSAEENGAIAVLVKEQHGGGGYWIGLSDREEESK